MPKASGKPFSRWLLFGLIACLLVGLPATTRQGVDHQIRQLQIPLGVKAAEFLLRDYRYRRLSSDLTRGLSTSEAQVAALFEWTHRQIRPTPPGWPVLDDHIANIIIRGYGQDDQMADVFTTLATYAGSPSFWQSLRSNPSQRPLVLSFVRLGGQWTVWDVEAGVAFRDRQGRLINVEELTGHPELVELAAEQAPLHASGYRLHLPAALLPWTVPETLRAEKQMGIRRIQFEIRRAVQTTARRFSRTS